jgi:hypothetical protein
MADLSMSDLSMSDEKAKENLNQLKAKCHQLIEVLAKQRYAASLLSKTIGYLEMSINYKKERVYQRNYQLNKSSNAEVE